MEPGEISALGWCDIHLESIVWEREGRDLLFHLLLPHQQSATSRHRVLSCRWAEGVEIRLSVAGRPLTWDASFTRLGDGRWSVLLDFAGSGEIRLQCAEVEIQE